MSRESSANKMHLRLIPRQMDRAAKPKKRGRVMWAFVYIAGFIAAFCIGIVSKMMPRSWAKDYTVQWSDSVGTVYTDLSYGEADANKFDLYVPADGSKENYGLVVYLHAGGFTTGDKADDREMLQWLCSKGYVAAGINYTLRDEAMKDISALLWVDDDTVPSLMAYSKHDRVQAFEASVRLDEALTAHGIPHDYIVLEHSGHGLQNDDKEAHLYSQKIEEYLDKYMPVK